MVSARYLTVSGILSLSLITIDNYAQRIKIYRRDAETQRIYSLALLRGLRDSAV
jgi:hypothetical protein